MASPKLSTESMGSPPPRSPSSATTLGSPVPCSKSAQTNNNKTALLKRMSDNLNDAYNIHTPKRIRFTLSISKNNQVTNNQTIPGQVAEVAEMPVAQQPISEVAEMSGTQHLLANVAEVPKTVAENRDNDSVCPGVSPEAWARPAPSGHPIVWANKRGALCEALPYFKSFQGSLHSRGVVAQGFLIDSLAEVRDLFGAEVIISYLGGHRVKDADTGMMVRTTDAKESDKAYKAIKNALEKKSLVAIIAGEGHPLYPSRPLYCYAVLGWFHVTDLWPEQLKATPSSEPVLSWRVRFEKADLGGTQSWWIPEGIVTPDCPGSLEIRCPIKTCEECGTPSKEVFNAGWTCLNHECSSYFTLPGLKTIDHDTLAYTDKFLKERTPFDGEIPPIRPDLPDHAGCHGTELTLRAGFVCPDCGCCNRRVYWNRWVCENKICGYNREAPMLPYPLEELARENAVFDRVTRAKRHKWGVNRRTFQGPYFSFDRFATIYHRGYMPYSYTVKVAGYTVRQYFLTDCDGVVQGSFAILGASPDVVKRRGGITDLFRELELTDIGLRRNPAAAVGHKLEGYTRHFQQNFGARYKFGVPVQSKGFAEAPDVILKCLHRLMWARKLCVRLSNAFISTLDERLIGEDAIVSETGEFNELLALGYMEADKINYHDDGEGELGPVVAALSLGSPSTMSFRWKRKTGFMHPQHMDRGKKCYMQCLEVTMKHGDMMVMVGPKIQKLYEHTVDPHGKRRFSLTARFIDPAKMSSQEDIADAAIKGAIPPHAAAFKYDGY